MGLIPQGLAHLEKNALFKISRCRHRSADCVFHLARDQTVGQLEAVNQHEAERFLKRRLGEIVAEQHGGRAFVGPQQERVTINELLDALESDYKLRDRWNPKVASNVKPLREHFGTWRAVLPVLQQTNGRDPTSLEFEGSGITAQEIALSSSVRKCWWRVFNKLGCTANGYTIAPTKCTARKLLNRSYAVTALGASPCGA